MALTGRERRIVWVSGVLCTTLGFYMWVHEPLWRWRTAILDQAEQITLRRAQQGSGANRPAPPTSTSGTGGMRPVAGPNGQALLLSYLSGVEGSAGVRLMSISLGQSPVNRPSEQYVVQSVTYRLAVEGTFSSQIAFMRAVEQAPFAVSTDSVSLSTANPGETAKLLLGNYEVKLFVRDQSPGNPLSSTGTEPPFGRPDPFAPVR